MGEAKEFSFASQVDGGPLFASSEPTMTRVPSLPLRGEGVTSEAMTDEGSARSASLRAERSNPEQTLTIAVLPLDASSLLL